MFKKSMRKAVNVVEYISRENAIEIVKSGGYWEREDMDVALTCIEQTPTADVVEVVRCKDCKYYQDNNNGYPHNECKWRQDETPDADDFCSYGERKMRGNEILLV